MASRYAILLLKVLAIKDRARLSLKAGAEVKRECRQSMSEYNVQAMTHGLKFTFKHQIACRHSVLTSLIFLM